MSNSFLTELTDEAYAEGYDAGVRDERERWESIMAQVKKDFDIDG